MVKEEDRAATIYESLLFKTVIQHDSFNRIKAELASGVRDTDNALYSMFILGVDFMRQQIMKPIELVMDWQVLKVKDELPTDQVSNTATTLQQEQVGAQEKPADVN